MWKRLWLSEKLNIHFDFHIARWHVGFVHYKEMNPQPWSSRVFSVARIYVYFYMGIGPHPQKFDEYNYFHFVFGFPQTITEGNEIKGINIQHKLWKSPRLIYLKNKK